jgi:hypothetical protein
MVGGLIYFECYWFSMCFVGSPNWYHVGAVPQRTMLPSWFASVFGEILINGEPRIPHHGVVVAQRTRLQWFGTFMGLKPTNPFFGVINSVCL